MQTRGRNEQVKSAYKKAFEDTFVDGYSAWGSTLKDVNALISAINKEEKTTHTPYHYDEFCQMAKRVIDDYLDVFDFDGMIADVNVENKLSGHHKNGREFHKRIERRVVMIETEVLFLCCEQAVMGRVGKKLCKKYKAEIDRFKEQEVTL